LNELINKGSTIVIIVGGFLAAFLGVSAKMEASIGGLVACHASDSSGPIE
jgi:hypothetical protein